MISQNTTKSTSTIFSSPVSIRLSSGTSRTALEASRPSKAEEPRMPISMRLTRVTFGSSTCSIGYGQRKFRPGGSWRTYFPNLSTMPSSSGFTRTVKPKKPISAIATTAISAPRGPLMRPPGMA